jgi:hypothetical protein
MQRDVSISLDMTRQLRENVTEAMEFAFCHDDGKLRELMTPSKQEGFFYAQLCFRNARRRPRDWSALLDLGIHR